MGARGDENETYVYDLCAYGERVYIRVYSEFTKDILADADYRDGDEYGYCYYFYIVPDA